MEKFGPGSRDKHPGSATLAMVPVSDNDIILLDNIFNVQGKVESFQTILLCKREYGNTVLINSLDCRQVHVKDFGDIRNP